MRARHRWRAGVRLGLGPALVVMMVGLSFGATARQAGWGVLAPAVFSAIAFSGSAQFTLVEGLASGSAAAAVVAAVLVNARYLVMGLALNGSLSGGRWRRSWQAQALCDASFSIGHRGGGRFDLILVAGASLPQWLGWVAGTTIGAMAAPEAGWFDAIGADVAFPAFFTMLVVAELRRDRAVPLVVLTSAVLSAGLLHVVDPGTVLLLVAGVALIGLRAGREAGDGG